MTSEPKPDADLSETAALSLRFVGAIAPISPTLSAQLRQLSPAALAYLGDAVYELVVRSHCLLPPKRIQLYHSQVVAQVRAEAQAHQLQLLQPHLTAAEQAILKQGRNAAGKTRRADPEIYQQATALETLLGYLYLSDPQRLAELLSHLLSQNNKTLS